MFAAGASLEGMDPARSSGRDQKIYTEGARRFSLSQFETVGFGPDPGLKEGLATELERIIQAEKCSFAGADDHGRSHEASLLLCRGESRVLARHHLPPEEENLFEMKECSPARSRSFRILRIC